MIIGFTFIVAAMGVGTAFGQTPLVAEKPAVTLKNGIPAPDPVRFRIRMELGDIAQARQWLEAGLNPDFMGDRLGTGLHIAAWHGHIELMALFHHHGAGLDQNNANDETPLQLAAYKGHQAAVEWLLARGSALNPPAAKTSWTALHYAAFAGHMNLVKRFLEKGADINARSPNGSTPLMAAIYEGRIDVAEHLLRQGANRTLKNDWDEGALEWAMKFNQTQFARQLADPETFAAAASKPKSTWNSQRSESASPELLSLLSLREVLLERNLSTDKIDSRIASMRAQQARANLEQNPVKTLRLDALEIRPTAQQQRQKP